MSAIARLCTVATAACGYSNLPVSLRTVEMPLQAPVPVAEQGAQSRCDDRRGGAQGWAKLEGDAVAHNGFRVAVGCNRALMPPSAHAHHCRLLVETAPPLQFCDGQQVIVERQHTEQP